MAYTMQVWKASRYALSSKRQANYKSLKQCCEKVNIYWLFKFMWSTDLLCINNNYDKEIIVPEHIIERLSKEKGNNEEWIKSYSVSNTNVNGAVSVLQDWLFHFFGQFDCIITVLRRVLIGFEGVSYIRCFIMRISTISWNFCVRPL